MMEIKEYQKLSVRTLPNNMEHNDLIINMIYGIIGETGEVVDIIKKNVYQGHTLNKDLLVEELGDIMFYIANLCNLKKIDMSYMKYLDIDYTIEKYELYKIISEIIKAISGIIHAIDLNIGNFIGLKILCDDIDKLMNTIYKLCAVYDIDMNNVLRNNYNKLLDRYPDGFEMERSINRKS